LAYPAELHSLFEVIMRKLRVALWLSALLGIPVAFTSITSAHGFVGDRFFPPTISTDDPFAVDEFALPTISYFRNDGEQGNQEIDAGWEFDKEIIPHFAVGVSNNYISQHGIHGPSAYGFDNLAVTGKYQLWQNDEHEAIFSIGGEADIARTGGSQTSDDFTTLTPFLYFGKGFGDLPGSLSAFRPFAVTGQIGQNFTETSKTPNSLFWGFALEYSLPHLETEVQDTGLPHPFRDMIPLVEFSMNTAEGNPGAGITTGTIDPGVLWETPYCQVGVEAVIPVNHQSGDHVGVIVQAWIFIDDLFPKVFGHPLFGQDE
jgi:hypothetical protein